MADVKPIPDGYPRVSPYLVVDGAAQIGAQARGRQLPARAGIGLQAGVEEQQRRSTDDGLRVRAGGP